MPTTPSSSSSMLALDTRATTPSGKDDHTNDTSALGASPAEHASNANDIGVIGYSCRVPGANNTPSQLWDFLLRKGDGSGDMPKMRWEPYNTRQPGNAELLSKTTSKGYFLDRLEDFDAAFFGISPREAEQIDPQQRIAVEVAWEALEHAGIPPQSLSGSDTAVFMGVNSDDYSRLLLEDLSNIESWMGVGTAFCGIPNRISYLLDLMGPSSAVDAACASSLVAIHHGRQALLAKETSLVIAGGVNALIGPGLTRVLEKAGAIATDGRCRSFDDTAAGYGRGEGAGIVILKRLADAIEDNDHILAILKGSAVGADGRTNGIMAPNQQAQERVARQALKEAGVSADTISYIEAHATSTPLGDPTECAAMANVYGSGARTPRSEPCFIGSIKPNIGHLEAGAGVMGFIKAVMATQHKLIPPQANLNTPSSKINWKDSLLRTVTEPTPWITDGQPLRAAVASYGYGGTVSHAIIEAASTGPPSFRKLLSNSSDLPGPTILTLSGIHPSRIKPTAAKLARWLEGSQQNNLDSMAYTLAVKRGHHKFRIAIIAETQAEAVEFLDKVATEQQHPQIVRGHTLSKENKNGAVWMFSGHGAQWRGMGQLLIDTESPFAEVVHHLEPIIAKEMGFSITAALRSGDFETTDKIQVVTYVMQVGLAAVLKANGAVPRACIGHSLGEIAACVTAGALTSREGALVCCIRARLYQRVAGEGAMIIISIPSSEAAEDIDPRADIHVAIHASPTSCVLSGTVEAVKELSAILEAKGIEVRAIKSDVAFHTPLLMSLVAPLREQLTSALTPKLPDAVLYSTSSLDPRAKRSRDVEYWVDNMIKPVHLTSAVAAASEDGYKVFVEISSHPIITHSVNETLMNGGTSESTVIPTLVREKCTRKSLLRTLGKLYCMGDSLNFKQFLPGNWSRKVPATIWEHQPYWRAVTNPAARNKITHDVQAHVLLGDRAQIGGTNNVLWQTYLDHQVKPFPGSHALHGAEIVPAAVLLNTFLSAVPGYSLRSVNLRAPVVVSPPREVQVFLKNNQIRISSRLISLETTDLDDHSWLINTTSQFQANPLQNNQTVTSVDVAKIQARLPTRLSNTFSVDYLARVGVPEMGFPWQVLEHLEREGEMLARVHADPGTNPSKHWSGSSWASILDAATSISSTIFYKEPLLRMPTAIDSVILLANTSTPKLSYVSVKRAVGDYVVDVLIFDDAGTILVDIKSLRFAGIEGIGGSASSRTADTGFVYRIAWPPAPLAESSLRFRKVLFVAVESPLIRGYRAQLSATGIENRTVAALEDISEMEENTIVICIATGAECLADVYPTSLKNCEMLLSIVKQIMKMHSKKKVFCITQNASMGSDSSALSQAPLIGIARIMQSEAPDVFGALIDVDDNVFPMQAIKYIRGVDVIRVEDTISRNARLRPFTQDTVASKLRKRQSSFHIRPQGTYVITGGLGALGLEVAIWLVEKGAKRLVLVSRRKLPARRSWDSRGADTDVQRILVLEAMGVSIYTLAVDMTATNASSQLQSGLEGLSLPPVLGVIHAAGTLANQTIAATTSQAFDFVISPKILGAIALHELFPPKKLDFMVLFSSCGQLLGFPGQAAYASGNAFLDTMATHRRSRGDNTISIMWTSWRGLGMAASTKYINAELHARGVADVTKEEALCAWEQIFKRDTDHAVVLRILPIDSDDPSPHPILNDCLIRRPKSSVDLQTRKEVIVEPTGGAELEAFLEKKVIQCVASTLSLSEEFIDPHVALLELGMDSVMTVELRGRLQKSIGIKVGPTLIWNCPTASHLAQHFVDEKSR